MQALAQTVAHEPHAPLHVDFAEQPLHGQLQLQDWLEDPDEELGELPLLGAFAAAEDVSAELSAPSVRCGGPSQVTRTQ